MLKFKKSKFVNGNRLSIERRVRYCFIRQLGYSRYESRILVGFSDNVFYNVLKSLSEYGENENVCV